MINLQINIDKMHCTHFEIIKLCAFILAFFKKDKDCIIIEIPLKEISPQIIGAVEVDIKESSFEPLVTSKMPNKIDFIEFLLNPNFESIGNNIFVSVLKMFNTSNISAIR